MKQIFSILFVSTFLSCSLPAYADEALQPRAETNFRYGSERSILLNEIWIPLQQDEDSVLYGDLRLMGDDQDNNEGNAGIGYRRAFDLGGLGKGVAGVHGWLDRRITENDSKFNQATIGAEWLGAWVDLRLNGYFSLSNERTVGESGPAYGDAYFEDSNMFVTRLPQGQLIEEIMDGGDAEIGFRVPAFTDSVDAIRLYGGGYYFSGDHSGDIAGWRARMTADITSDVQVGGRFQKDDVRGSQGFLEATVRFPFGHKKSYRDRGVLARLDESPERDIDIVTGTAETPGTGEAEKVAIYNADTHGAQKVIHVDNSAAGGGDGSRQNPFNTLQAAQAAAQSNEIIYVHRGDGTTTNQDQGIVLSRAGMTLAGSGAPLSLSTSGFRTQDGQRLPAGVAIRAAAAPVIANINADSDGVTVNADNVTVQGIRIDSATRYGIAVVADGAGASAQNTRISNVTATGSKTGIMVHGANGGAVSASIQNTAAYGNTQHGISIYDDTSGTFTVDLGGGTMGSAGGNSLTGNGLEDLTIDYDGRALYANGNWWGQAGGPQAGQVYFGAPLDDDLVGHWLMDENSGTSIASRIGTHNGSFVNSPTLIPNGGILDGAVSFDQPQEDVISIPDYDDTDTGDKLTVSYWINPDTLVANAGHILKWTDASWDGDNSWVIRANPAGDEVYVFIAAPGYDDGNNYFSSSDLDLAAGAWTNVTFVYDGAGATDADRLKLYKNGVQVNGTFVGTIPTSLTNTNKPITIGRQVTELDMFGDFLDGRMDDVRIYNSALSAGSVEEISRSRSDSTLRATGSLSAAP